MISSVRKPHMNGTANMLSCWPVVCCSPLSAGSFKHQWHMNAQKPKQLAPNRGGWQLTRYVPRSNFLPKLSSIWLHEASRQFSFHILWSQRVDVVPCDMAALPACSCLGGCTVCVSFPTSSKGLHLDCRDLSSSGVVSL